MKQLFKHLMGGMLLMAMPLMMTSCEGTLDDIFGEWSRPTPGSSTGGAVTSIGLDADEMKLTVGDKGQLTAKVDPAGTAVTWSSDKEEIATVDANGLVTAVAMGTAIITAKAGDKLATCTVTVTPGLSTPLTVEAITAGTITITNPQSGMKYSTDGGTTKTEMTSTTNISVAEGDKVAFYGNGTSIKAYYSDDSDFSNDTNISGGTAQVKVYGNIMSLVDETGYEAATKLTGEFAFRYLFYGNTMLTDISDLQLPATKLTNRCYDSMFQGCTGLTTLPEKLLPATTLAEACYRNMFYGCTSLTTIPEALLPATNLTNQCYDSMFQSCTGLTTVPEKLLPATTLTYQCYQSMFYGCTSLTTLPEKLLPATTLADYCYQRMFQDCEALTETPKLPATELKAHCYQYMFQGCACLSSVTCLATDISPFECTSNWLKDVAVSGTFTKSSSTTTWSSDASGIPSGWSVQNYVAP